MKLYILQYATQEDVDAELDDRNELDLETMASPQFACIATAENLEAAITQVKQNVQDAMDELREGAEEPSEYEWIKDDNWATPIYGRRNRTIFLHDAGDETPIAQIVIQEEEAFTN